MGLHCNYIGQLRYSSNPLSGARSLGFLVAVTRLPADISGSAMEPSVCPVPSIVVIGLRSTLQVHMEVKAKHS